MQFHRCHSPFVHINPIRAADSIIFSVGKLIFGCQPFTCQVSRSCGIPSGPRDWNASPRAWCSAILSVSQMALHYLIAASNPGRSAASSQQAEARPSGPGGRADLPVAAPSRRASFAVALQAADPNNRQQALQNLKNDMMSRSTNPASDARVQTYMSVCRAWDVTSFPLDTTNVIPVQKFGYVLLRLVWASTTSS